MRIVSSGAPPLSCASVIRASNAAQPGNPKLATVTTSSAAPSSGERRIQPRRSGRWRDPKRDSTTAAHVARPVFVAASATSQIRAGPQASGVSAARPSSTMAPSAITM